MKPATAIPANSTGQYLWFVLPLVLAVLPHARHLPLWISGYFLAMVALRYASFVSNLKLPGGLLRTTLTLATLFAVYLSFGSLQGRSAGVGLLIALLGLKLMELNSPRDAYLTIFVGFFVVVTNFFFSESIPMVIYLLLVSALFTASLIKLNDPDQALNFPARLRVAGVLLAQAVPLMLVLFVLYPRIPGPLWGMPEDTYSGYTGLSEQMSPGKISKLSQSDAVAFRVKFNDTPPPAMERYWRGPVLWHTDGVTWSYGFRNEGDKPEIQTEGSGFDYTITLEPHNKRWLFGLDVPLQGPHGSYMTGDLQLLSRRPVTQRKLYQLRSYPNFLVTNLSERDHELALLLPSGFHPAARGLARQWKNTTESDAAIVEQALNYFRDNPFYYTLSPPPVSNDFVDGFLFGTRRGFCEHYAAAFTVLMRAAGIPARVVTGYQGGEFNPLGEYLIVRQRDAHAWSEVWLDDSGWTRVDPTAAVSPARVEVGIDIALPKRNTAGILGLSVNTPVGRLWLGLHRRWDSINNRWNQWVLAYGPELQAQLLIRAGLGQFSWRELAAGLVALLLLATTLIAWLLSRQSFGQDKQRALFELYCRRLAKRGIPREPSEGPADFAARASAKRPDLQAAIRRITELYIDLRYGKARSTTRELSQAIRQFHP